MTQLATDEEVGIGAAPALMGDAEVGLPPTGDLPTPPSDSNEKIGPTNYGRFAAARIAQARFKAQAAGNDLSNPEQLAIMDAYRQAAGLPTLSNVDSFKEAQQHIARHQSDVLNLARSTSAAFERQAVDLVSEAVDKINPGWGTRTRADIAAMNPFDADRISGKAGGIVASMPLLLAGGGPAKLAALFGLESMTEGLATSTDTGITGLKKWGGSAAQGAVTAASLLIGGKLSEWITKGLAGKIPELQRLLTTGATTEAADVITRQAALVGIRMPWNVSLLVAGQLGNNLIAAQSTDPNRKWHDHLGETAFLGVAMEIGGGVAGIPGGIKATRTARAIEVGPRPEDIGPTVYTPPAGRVSEAPPDQAVSAASTDYPAGRLPTILTEHPASTMTGGPSISNFAIQGSAGTAEHPEVVYIDPVFPRVLDIGTKPVDIHSFIAVHETVERQLLDSGNTYENIAHARAEAAEHAAVQRAGVDPIAYEKALAPYEAKAQKKSLADAPADLDRRPYLERPAALPRPKSITTSEANLNRTPDGRESAIPHATYETADQMSPPNGRMFGPDLTENAGENLWIRPSTDPMNEKRVLLVQFSTNLINKDRPRTTADDYYDKLYSNRPGYSRPSDFWELPQWIGVAAHNLPNSDVYVVRDLAEAAKFLDSAKYGQVAFSALDVNSPLIQKLLETYKGKVAIGGYTDMAPFKGGETITGPVLVRKTDGTVFRGKTHGEIYAEHKAELSPADLRDADLFETSTGRVVGSDEAGVIAEKTRQTSMPGLGPLIAENLRPASISNVTVYDGMADWIKSQGGTFKDGTDYRHFRDTETQPRLQLSSGCLHHCGFCSMPRTIVKTTPEGVQQQIKSFGDLNYRLVYLNDKTFGQADNYPDLVKINKQLQEQNPKFEGFIIQTTASQMLKFSPEFLAKSGIKYVELGVESYNDPILKPLHKPANETIIDKATDVIRKAGMKLIPNIIVGIPDETPETYAKTQDYLKRNIDVISHVNVNNLAAYAGTELTAKIGKTEARDVDQNVTARSFHKDPALHQAAYEEFTKIGQTALEQPSPPSTRPEPGLLQQLHRDVQGGVPAEKLLNTLGAEDVRAMGRAAVDTIRSAAEDAQRTFAAGTRGEGARATEAAVRQGEGRAARQRDIRQQAFGKAKDGFDKYTRVNGQAAADEFMDRINRGERQADPSLQGLADSLDADRRATVVRMKNLGVGAGEKFDENWFGRQWTNSEQARQFFLSRRPLTGPKTFLKGRTLESVAEGRAAGLELTTDNPVEMHLWKMDEMEKYIEGVNSLKQLESLHFAERIKSGSVVPRDWQRIHDQIGLYKAKNPVTGEQETGSFYAPEKVATVINNHLSPGLMNKAWFRTYMSAANWQNQFQLGLSSFHLFTTSANAMMSQFALGLREGFRGGKQILHGDVVGGAENIGRGLVSAVTSPLAPVFAARRGHEGLAEWRSPGTESPLTQRIVSLMADANARAQSDPFYRTHLTDKMMSAFRQGNVLGGLGRALFLPIELPTRAIMDYVVPHLKFGASMDLIAMELRNNPGISNEALLAKTRSAWDSADNRMGQLVYNNLYWNQTTKHIAMAMVRSVGWNLGTFRELVGGTYDLAKMPVDLFRGKPVDLTNRAAYTLALPMVHAAIGSFLNYVFTGEGPQDLKDCMFPRTGEKDEHGNPQRVSLWTYMKDVYHYGIDWKGTLAGKLHPMVQGLYSMVTNKDFYGEKIRNEDDPFMQQVKQSVVAAAKSFEPLSSRNVRRGLEMGETPAQLSRTAIGLTPAPLAINQSPAEQRASEIIREKIPVGARTHKEVEKTHLKHDLARKFAAGDTDAIPAALQADQISKDDAKAILKESRQKPLQVQVSRLDAKEALQVWMKATPEERASIRVQLLKHLSGMKGHATIAERKEMIEQYRLAGVL